jgi:hypothetical protein
MEQSVISNFVELLHSDLPLCRNLTVVIAQIHPLHHHILQPMQRQASLHPAQLPLLREGRGGEEVERVLCGPIRNAPRLFSLEIGLPGPVEFDVLNFFDSMLA